MILHSQIMTVWKIVHIYSKTERKIANNFFVKQVNASYKKMELKKNSFKLAMQSGSCRRDNQALKPFIPREYNFLSFFGVYFYSIYDGSLLILLKYITTLYCALLEGIFFLIFITSIIF